MRRGRRSAVDKMPNGSKNPEESDVEPFFCLIKINAGGFKKFDPETCGRRNGVYKGRYNFEN
jgi:hypothetical protein